MKTAPFNFDGDMADVKRWWEGQNYPDIEGLLSHRGRIVAGVCAAWLYLADGPMAMISWSVANPDASPRDVSEGFQLIFKEMLAEAKENGATVVLAVTGVTGLAKTFKRCGFQEGDKDCISLFAGV